MRAVIRLAIALIALAVGVQAAGARESASSARVLRLLEVPEGFTPLTPIDFSKPLKPGDTFAYVQGLYTWSGSGKGERIGHLDGTCQIVSSVSTEGIGKAYCLAHAFLGDGAILFQGIQRVTAGLSRYSYPITGGTGRYASVRGWVAIRDLSETGKTADVFHLSIGE